MLLVQQKKDAESRVSRFFNEEENMTKRKNITILPETEEILRFISGAKGRLSTGIEELVNAVMRMQWYSENINDFATVGLLVSRMIDELGIRDIYNDRDKKELQALRSAIENADLFHAAAVDIPGEGEANDGIDSEGEYYPEDDYYLPGPR